MHLRLQAWKEARLAALSQPANDASTESCITENIILFSNYFFPFSALVKPICNVICVFLDPTQRECGSPSSVAAGANTFALCKLPKWSGRCWSVCSYSSSL